MHFPIIVNKRFALALLAGVFLLSSCSKFNDELDTTSESQLSSSDIFKTPARIEGLVNGLYKTVKTNSGRVLLNADWRGEDFINLTNNAFTGFDAWANNYSGSSADVASIWEGAYASINNSNILIDGLDKTSGVIDEVRKKQYLGEAYFLRAYNYFILVTLYARPYREDNGASEGIPLRLKPETSADGKNLARSSVAKVYASIIADLDLAEANLPLSYSTKELNTTRAHRNTAIALKTRVYLSAGNFEKVVSEAVKIVPQTSAPFAATSGVNHALQADVTTVFTSDYTTTESILSMPVTTADPPTTALGGSYNVNADFSLNTSGIFGNAQWGAEDARRKMTRLNTANSQNFLMKYAKPSPYLDYIPLIRYAEVLLNYAEAAALTGDTPLAIRLLEAVHLRSDAGYVFPSASIAMPQALVETIWTERRIELLGEGFRSNDLLRNLLPIPGKSSSSFNARQVLPGDAGYIFPIPDNEVLANELL